MIALKNINPLYLFFSVIQPAISEYERMKLKYEIEFNCRTQAEMLATKVSENQIICKFMINDNDWVNAIRLSRNGELAWQLQSYCREIIINFFFEVPFFNFFEHSIWDATSAGKDLKPFCPVGIRFSAS